MSYSFYLSPPVTTNILTELNKFKPLSFERTEDSVLDQHLLRLCGTNNNSNNCFQADLCSEFCILGNGSFESSTSQGYRRTNPLTTRATGVHGRRQPTAVRHFARTAHGCQNDKGYALLQVTQVS